MFVFSLIYQSCPPQWPHWRRLLALGRTCIRIETQKDSQDQKLLWQSPAWHYNPVKQTKSKEGPERSLVFMFFCLFLGQDILFSSFLMSGNTLNLIFMSILNPNIYSCQSLMSSSGSVDMNWSELVWICLNWPLKLWFGSILNSIKTISLV